MRVSFKTEIQPTPAQRQALLQHAGNARWAFNWGLARHKAAYAQWVELGKPKKWDGWPNDISLHQDLNRLKKVAFEDGGIPWMYEASKAAPQEALRNLDCAFRNFMAGRAAYPQFKNRNQGIGGFRLTGTIKVSQRSIQLPRIGRLRIKPGDHGYLPLGKHAQVSVSESAGRWFVSVVGPDAGEATPNDKMSIGVDLGVARLATLSDGTVIENPKALAQSQKKIKWLQKSLSRKKKGSSNSKKAKARLAKAHARVRNVRQDALHKATTILAKNHGCVVIEDLKVRNMTRVAKGRGRAAKAGLNRVLADAAFSEFRRLLEYKGKLYGCEIIAVPAHYTSQRCSVCGYVDTGNRVTQAAFRCLSCGHEDNADLNAAINILKAGSCPVSACGEDVRPDQLRLVGQTPMKQESAVA